MDKQRDQFAEMYVAGCFLDAGWQVFFPHRDEGFDFIAAKQSDDGMLLRPVQVRGRYTRPDSIQDRPVYGKDEIKLSQTHPDMVVAMPFFSTQSPHAPHCVAYLQLTDLKTNSVSGVYRSQPAQLVKGIARPRPAYQHLFGEQGLGRLATLTIAATSVELPE